MADFLCRSSGNEPSGRRAPSSALKRSLVWAGILLLQAVVLAQEPRQLVPWLDLPASWALSVKDGVVAAVPGDLPPGTSLLLMVEPESQSTLTLDAEYQKALHDLGGGWTPIGEPNNQPRDGGWTFRVGVGTVTLNGTRYIAQTAVARCGQRRVRSWILASSDVVFNRYKSVTATAIASAQDITLKAHPAAAPASAAAPAAGSGPTPVMGGPVYVGKVPPGFGEGVSGVYLGLERSAHMHAGYAIGSPSVSLEDDYEIDVFYPDGTYRRRFPDRGLASDPRWERSRGGSLWGTWTRSGNLVVVKRGNYTTSYRIQDANTLISDRDRPWTKLRLQAGSHFDGVYASSNRLGPEDPRLVLRPDGTYEDRGGFLHAYAGPESLVVPDGLTMIRRWSTAQCNQEMGGGRGTYTYADFTLTLRDQDGRVWQVGLGVPPGEQMPSPRWLLMDQSRLIRQ
jgi:hypothetical protein